MLTAQFGEVLNRVRNRPGIPLPRPQRDFFECGFDCSLDSIRLHIDRNASEALGAEAFAVGRHIVLREAPRNWDALSTRYLLCHEIAHCLQQRSVGDEAPAVALGASEDPLEREAHRAAMDILAGRPAGPLSREAHAVVRRAVSVVSKSADIIPKKKPAGTAPKWMENEKTSEQAMVFNVDATDGFTAIGTARLRGDKEGEIAGYTLGWIQCQLMETNWAIYRGLEEKDGSQIFKYGWKPPMAVCRDAEKNVILYNADYGSEAAKKGVVNKFVAPKGLKESVMACEFRDFPSDSFPIQQPNSLTKKTNFIEEAMIELYFCTVLTLLSPDNKTFEHLKHVYWNIRWHYHFKPPDAKGNPLPVPVKGADAGKLCSVQDGAPKDSRVLEKLIDRTATSCNVRSADINPVVDEKATKSERFDTTRSTRSLDETASTYDCFKK
jgi:hypothetical protein